MRSAIKVPISVTRALLDQLTPRPEAFVSWARENLPLWSVCEINGKWCVVHRDDPTRVVCVTARLLDKTASEERARAVADVLNRVYA